MPAPPTVRVTLYDRAGTTLVSTLDHAFDIEWRESVSEVGMGKFTYPMASPDAALIQRGQVVQCAVYDEENVYAWRIETVEHIRVASDEDHGQVIQVSGLGKATRLNDAKIYPPRGINQTPPVDVRSFSFASPEYDDSTWPQAEEKAFFGDLGTEWTGIVDGELVAAPFGWPDLPWNPAWIWSADSDTDQGIAYFRKAFFLFESSKVTIIASGDNYWTLYLDGVALLGDNTFAEAWNEHRRVELQLSGGQHWFAAVVNNIAPSIAGLLVAIYIDQGFTCTPQPDVFNPETLEYEPVPDECVANDPIVVHVTDAGWRCLAYQTNEPGMTPGKIIQILLTEAQARGQLLDIVLGFDEFYDSASNAWAMLPEIGATVGDSILDMLNKLANAGWCEWYMRPETTGGNTTLQMWPASGAGRFTVTTATLATPYNIVDITHAVPGRLVNRLLVKYAGGLFNLDDGASQAAVGEIIEDFLTLDAADLVEAQRLAQRSLDEATAEQAAITVTVEPIGAERPYVDYMLGDYITAPNEAGVATSYRVLGISITEDDEGEPFISLELNRRTFHLEQERVSLFATLGSGVVGKNAGSERVPGYLGSGD